MGQIIGRAANPKRCNLNKLSQLGTPAAGEHILVSSDNYMNAAGQGNFDCYIVGDGTTAASTLELKSIADAILANSKNSIQNAVVFAEFGKLEGKSAQTIDLSMYPDENGTVLSDLTFRSNGAYGNIKHKVIPIEAGRTIRVTPISTSMGTIIVFLKSSTLVSGSRVDACDGVTGTTTLYNPADLVVPADASYLYVYSKSGSGVNYLPTSIEYYAQKGLIELAQEAAEQYSDGKLSQFNADTIVPMGEDIDTLFGIVSTSDVPPENAVKYIPTNTIYVGTNILNINDAVFDSSYWSVNNGVISYNGNGSTATPFQFRATTENEARYFCEVVLSTSDNAYEGLLRLQIGNGELIDIYNGTANQFGGLVSDGGSFKIIPFTKAFNVVSITLKKVVASTTDAEYSETKTIPVDNVDSGNSARTSVDGKWNVAIGPIGTTFANNINASRSVAIGTNALRFIQFGIQNIAIGSFALSLIKAGNHNIAIGSDTLYRAESAEDNVLIGKGVLGSNAINSKIERNVAVGHDAMARGEGDSSYSVAVGYQANFYGARQSVFVGCGSQTTAANRTIVNVIAIGYNTRATKSNQCVLGNASVSEFVLGNKKLIFNQDGTVSWESVS